jgi:hypothetical protein
MVVKTSDIMTSKGRFCEGAEKLNAQIVAGTLFSFFFFF